MLREFEDVGEVASLGPIEQATTLRPASSSGAKVGPIRLAVAGCSGGESKARSTSNASSPWTMSRQNVASSLTLSMVQPRS